MLNTVLALYVAFVENNTIFEGKRRTLASRVRPLRRACSRCRTANVVRLGNRWLSQPPRLTRLRPLQISTERLTISSLAASSPRTFTSSSWVPFPLSLLAPSPSVLSPPPSTSTSSSSPYPLYALTLSYSRSSSGGKALLHRATTHLVRPCADMFDGEGRLARGVVERWVAEGLREVQGEHAAGGAGAGEKDRGR